MRVELAGETVLLDAARALVWGDAVVIADPHFGKDASARAGALPIPRGPTADDLARLDALLARHAARELWMLGDVFDSVHAGEAGTRETLARWRERHGERRIRMVAGNHDRRALAVADAVGFERLPDGAAIGPWRLTHHPAEIPGGYALCGHIHPGLRLAGRGRDRLRLPAFVLGTRRAILPAFGGLTGLANWEPAPGERVYVVAGDAVRGPYPPGR